MEHVELWEKGWKGTGFLWHIMALVCQDAKLWASPFLSHGGHPPTSRHSEPQKGNIRNIIVTYGKRNRKLLCVLNNAKQSSICLEMIQQSLQWSTIYVLVSKYLLTRMTSTCRHCMPLGHLLKQSWSKVTKPTTPDVLATQATGSVFDALLLACWTPGLQLQS